jgi:hypothetical protein
MPSTRNAVGFQGAQTLCHSSACNPSIAPRGRSIRPLSHWAGRSSAPGSGAAVVASSASACWAGDQSRDPRVPTDWSLRAHPPLFLSQFAQHLARAWRRTSAKPWLRPHHAGAAASRPKLVQDGPLDGCTGAVIGACSPVRAKGAVVPRGIGRPLRLGHDNEHSGPTSVSNAVWPSSYGHARVFGTPRWGGEAQGKIAVQHPARLCCTARVRKGDGSEWLGNDAKERRERVRGVPRACIRVRRRCAAGGRGRLRRALAG